MTVWMTIWLCVVVRYILWLVSLSIIVLVVNIVDTKKEKVDDVIFPQGDVIAADKKWSKRHDSINISGKAIKSMGLDGKWCSYNTLVLVHLSIINSMP